MTTFRVVSVFQRAYDAVAGWRNARVTSRELMRLSDQQLTDIGLVRGEIAELAGSLSGR